MPDPDPLPPQPRAVSPARWLLLLLPSVLAIATPRFIGPFFRRFFHKRAGEWLDFRPEFLSLVIATLLCFYLGFRLEKWRHGEKWNGLRASACGVAILLFSTMVSYAGCTALYN